MAKNYVQPLIIQYVNAATISAITWVPFQRVAVTPIDEACFMLRFTNESNVDVFISFDGVNPHEIVASSTNITLSFQSNALPNNEVALVKKGTQFYVQGITGAGYIYLSGFYSK